MYNTFENWTIEELGCAANTLMRDLRGSWAESYSNRMRELERILVLIESYKIEGVEGFKANLKGDLREIRDKARDDLKVVLAELSDPDDGRVFRDFCHFYDARFLDGRTEQVKEYLLDWVVCDGWHWCQEGVEDD